MRRLLLAIAVLGLASLAAQDASAEACGVSTGNTRWTAVGTTTGTAWSGSPCTAGAGDDFTISGTANVEITADIALTTGSVTCTSGTLRIGPGAGITAAGGSARAVLTVSGTCNLIMDGAVVWQGRIGSATTTYAAGPPKTATFTVQGGSVTAATAAATTDYLVFGDDDPASATATITSPVQIGAGPPAPGYYRPTYPKWTWWDINAVAASTVTINTDAYTNPETLPTGAGTTPFTGTRGPGLTTSTAITSMARTPHGFMTAITLEVGAIADGDMGAQYVTVTTGACANRTYKIAYVDAAVGDVIYVYGDLTETCGATPEIVINYGWRNGDPIKVVRPAYIDGGKVGRIDWTGGTINANYARFVKLFPDIPSGKQYGCTLCIRRESTSIQPTFSSSKLTNIDLAYPGMVATGRATGAVAFDNLNATPDDFQFAGYALDASGLVMDRFYIHDQDLESTSGAEGVHGLLYVGTTGLTATRWRVARIGDDGVFLGMNVYSNTTQTQNATLRQFQIDEGMSLNNSQQLFDASYPIPGGNESNYSLTVSDYGGNCCTDGGFTNMIPNSTMDRIISSGTDGIPGGFILGPASTSYTSSAANVGATNVIRDSITMMLGPTSSNTNHLKMAAAAYDSIIAGNLIGPANQFYQAPYSLTRTFVDLGTANIEGFFRRVPLTVPALAAPTIYVTDSALLNGNTGIQLTLNDLNNGTGGAGNPSMEDTGTNISMSSYDITRSYFGARVPSGGLCDLNCNTADGIAGGRTLTANGITVAMTTSSLGGIGMGAAGEGTLEGARISNACVQTTALPTSDNVFGASYTSTSLTTVGAYPRPEMDVPLSNFVQQPGDSTICGSAARPSALGLKKFGLAHAMLGDGVAGNISLFTTDSRLIRQFGGSGGRGGGGSCIGTDCGGMAQ